MKTFLNVLFRRILYKIPLKFLLILLAVFAVLFASFSNAEIICIDSVSESSVDCPVACESGLNLSGLNWSSLYINDIQHLGGSDIYITIPEEIGRDYNYDEYDDMFITVSGYNVDYDKITGIIDVQNYKPSQEDFNNIIGILADYMPIIVIFLGLLFIYKMIRKPFKSKL